MKLTAGASCLHISGLLALALALPGRAAESVDTGAPLPTIPVISGENAAPAGQIDETEHTAVLETIVVTGENLAREQNRSTASVVVLTGIELERGTDASVYEVLAETPNVTTQPGQFGFGGISVRGIGTYGADAANPPAQFGTATAIVLDGIALPRFAIPSSDLSAFDLEQVEIYRGPQSTAIGRNALAGAVVIETRDPEFAAGLRARAMLADPRGGQLAISATGPLSDDVLAGRLTYDQRDSDGDLRNVTRNEDDWARDNNRTLRGKLLLQPGGADGRYRATLSGTWSRRENGSRYVEGENEDRRVATENLSSTTETGNQLLALRQFWNAGGDWTLSAVTAFMHNETTNLNDLDYSATDGGDFNNYAGAEGISQELGATYDGGNWRATLGGYGFDGREHAGGGGSLPLSLFARILGLCITDAICERIPGNVVSTGGYRGDNRNLAAFGEAEWQVLPTLSLVAGLRYDSEKNDRVFPSENNGDTPVSNVVVIALRAAGLFGPNAVYETHKRFDALLPRFAAVWELQPGWFAGASVARGYRAGGAAVNLVSGLHYEFDPEYTTNYELSLKGHAFGNRARVDLHLFQIDWDDMQVTIGSNLTAHTENAGKARVRGAEAELDLRLLPSLRLDVGAGYLDTRFIDFRSGNDDYSGNRLAFAPRWSASLALDWTPALWGVEGLFLHPQVQAQGDSYSRPSNSAEQSIDAHVLVNLKAGWQYGALRLYAYGNNLGDEQYRTDALENQISGGTIVALGLGRIVGAGVDYSF